MNSPCPNNAKDLRSVAPPPAANNPLEVAGKSHDLAVCCRIYPRVSGSPIFGFKDKLELVRLSLTSFRKSLGGLKIKLWVLLDNCPPEYKSLVESLFSDVEREIIALPGAGNGATFGRQIDILAAQQSANLVYFSEDDYLYLPGALETAVNFMRQHPEADFLTLFDHADHYQKYLHRISTPTYLESGRTWRGVASTCLTFLTRRQTLIETAQVFHTFQQNNSDLGVWLALTKARVFNPYSYVRNLTDGWFIPASQCLAWRHAVGQILFGKRRTLLAPAPALATHMEVSGLAPGVAWENIFGPDARK